MARNIDIEDLLGWTYRVQRADVILGYGLDLWQAERELEGIEWHGHSADGVYAILRRAELGLRVDVSRPQGGTISIHPDARTAPWPASYLSQLRRSWADHGRRLCVGERRSPEIEFDAGWSSGSSRGPYPRGRRFESVPRHHIETVAA